MSILKAFLLDLVDKLIGNLKEGKDIKRNYMQMLLSSNIKLNEEQIHFINESQKNYPSTILDAKMSKPDPALEKWVTLNPVL